MSADAASRVCEFVVKQIVDNPDGVSVAQSETDGGIRLDVSVADGDMGRVIGKRGRVASAIRTVVRAAGVDVEQEKEKSDRAVDQKKLERLIEEYKLIKRRYVLVVQQFGNTRMDVQSITDVQKLYIF